MRVLITDGNERVALAAARSLVRAGHEVHVAAAARWSLAGASRGVRPARLQSNPLSDPAGYAAEVGGLARRLDAGVLLPVTDPAIEALLVHRAALPRDVILPLPDHATYRLASDKVAMLERSRDAGLEIPDTIVLARATSYVPRPDFFPAVVKPHRSVVPSPDGRGCRKVDVCFVRNQDECRAALRRLPATVFPVMLQRRIDGPGEGLFVLRWKGQVLAEFAHRRLREKPPAGGVSVYRESIAPDPALVAAGRRLLADLDWQGAAMIECKRDLATGRHAFIEMNGRLWGSLQLAIDAGVDFPALLVACALGGDVAAVPDYRVGVRSRWFWGDLDHLYLRLRDGGRAKPRLAAVGAFCRVGRREREEIWRWRDPAPFLFESLTRLGIAG